MEINVSIEQGREPIAVMRLRGEINASNFMEIVDKARELYNNPARSLIIDLGEVTGISSAGQAAIHKIALIYSGASHKVEEGENPDFTHSSNARTRVKLLNPRPEVEKTIEKAGLKLFFKVFDDLESAIQSF
ncbi:MAG: STAS domain-containing protein [Anaerolineales bacterium]|nr:STAS domain-containing protein [Anaerolineales bacterium]NUQ83092.1 STAS domain-containing protein [Anaerolineales bacterium]